MAQTLHAPVGTPIIVTTRRYSDRSGRSKYRVTTPGYQKSVPVDLTASWDEREHVAILQAFGLEYREARIETLPRGRRIVTREHRLTRLAPTQRVEA